MVNELKNRHVSSSEESLESKKCWCGEEKNTGMPFCNRCLNRLPQYLYTPMKIHSREPAPKDAIDRAEMYLKDLAKQPGDIEWIEAMRFSTTCRCGKKKVPGMCFCINCINLLPYELRQERNGKLAGSYDEVMVAAAQKILEDLGCFKLNKYQ